MASLLPGDYKEYFSGQFTIPSVGQTGGWLVIIIVTIGATSLVDITFCSLRSEMWTNILQDQSKIKRKSMNHYSL